MFAILWWMFIGLVAGGFARILMPGQQPMGFVLTMLLGLIGSVVGGLLSALLFGHDPMAPGFHGSGLIMSTVGALIALGAYVAYGRRSNS